jgi:hypothetical protein
LDAGGIAVIGCTIALLVAVSGHRQSRIEARTAQIQNAASLLARHYEGLETFVEDPALPETLQDVLLSFSDAAADPNVAHGLRRAALGPSNAPVSTAGMTRRFEECAAQLRALRKHRPDLAKDFEAAVSDGVHALFLRWDETAPLYDELVDKMGAKPNQQLRLAVRLADAADKLHAGCAVVEKHPAEAA